MSVVRIHVFVEGQTEETFIRDLLIPYFIHKDIQLNAILIRTSSRGKGGATNYDKIKRQLGIKCKEDPRAFVTTMFDFFKLPTNFPGYSGLSKILDPYSKVEHLESEWKKDFNQKNFIPYISLHEFEALLFTQPQEFQLWFDTKSVEKLVQERGQFESPEHVNNGPETAPSKRILKHCKGYEKPLHGPLIAQSIGLSAIRSQCMHFDKWLSRLEFLI